EGEAQIGKLPIVGRRVRKMLDVPDRIVAGVTDGPATKPRQAGQLRRAVKGELLFEQFEGIRGLKLCPGSRLLGNPPRGGGAFHDRDSVTERSKAQERAGSHEAVPTHALAADDAFKQKGPVILMQFAERAHRRERVTQELAVDGDQACPARQLLKLLEA